MWRTPCSEHIKKSLPLKQHSNAFSFDKNSFSTHLDIHYVSMSSRGFFSKKKVIPYKFWWNEKSFFFVLTNVWYSLIKKGKNIHKEHTVLSFGSHTLQLHSMSISSNRRSRIKFRDSSNWISSCAAVTPYLANYVQEMKNN